MVDSENASTEYGCTVGDRRPTEDLVFQLGDPDIEVRSAAEEELGRRGTKALPFLRKALQDPDSEVASRAIDILERLERSFDWLAYRNGGQMALEIQAARFQSARDAIEELKGLGISISPQAEENTLIFTSEESRRSLEFMCTVAKVPITGIERIHFDGSLDLGVTSCSLFEFLKRLAPRSGIDVMLTSGGEILVGERRAIFDAITR